MDRESVIQTSGLTKTFDGNNAVDALDISVSRGEIYGFLGPNGAGKTTTIRMLMGLTRPTSGRATMLGLDVWSDRVQLHRSTGNLPGDFAYDETLTGRDLVKLFAGLRRVQMASAAESLAERFSADLDRPLKQLSSGNRQKIGLVLAFAHEPELVILDEPTAGLDPLMQEEFLTLADERREAGATIFLSSHNLAEVERSCDRVALIREGALIAVDSVDAMRHGFVHDVRIEFAEKPDAERFSRVPDVRVRSAVGHKIELDVPGSQLDATLRLALEWRVIDLTCSEPSLEQAFVHLYRENDNGRQRSGPQAEAPDA